ncbi:MAG TPA: hypothetical protein EYP14_06290 [Planctomycetaceae bacterium]|nr:hypothetical protein [Planctomycetaceae bacterium]
MKAQLLAGAENVSAESAAASQAGSDASPNETASEDQTSQPSVQETAADESTASETTHVPEIPAPEPIELDKADLEQLREAIEARDAYISYLLKKLKVAPTIAPPVDWEALQNTPDELKQKLQELQEQLTEKLRLAEVDLSLERARLAREEAALRLREEQLEQRLKQYGFEEADSADGENDSKRRRRWLKFLSRSEDRSQTGDSP